MKLFIPELGTQLQLTKNWKFQVMNESRNFSLLDAMTNSSNQIIRKVESIQYSICGWMQTEPSLYAKELYRPSLCYGMSYDEALEFYNRNRHTLESKETLGKHTEINLPKGTILEVDRIYIRQGNIKYSSVTFKIRKKKVIRFWVNLDEVNKIECKIVGEPSINRHKDISRISVGG